MRDFAWSPGTWLLLASASCWVFVPACGNPDDQGNGESGPAPTILLPPTGQLTPSEQGGGGRKIEGQIFWQDYSQPARGLQVWLLNQTTETLQRAVLDASGYFSFLPPYFKAGDSVGLGVADLDGHLLGFADFSPNGQAQSNLILSSEEAPLGRILIQADDGAYRIRGHEPSRPAPGKVGTNQYPKDLPRPKGSKVWGVGTSLDNLDPQEVYYSYVQPRADPAKKTRLLQSRLRYTFKASFDSSGQSRTIRLGTSWGRYQTLDWLTEKGWVGWQGEGFRIPSTAEGNYRADFRHGRIPMVGDAWVVDVMDGSNLKTFLLVLEKRLTTPPLVATMTQGNQAPLSPNEADMGHGYLRPVCRSSGDVTLSIQVPTYDDGSKIPLADWLRIAIRLEWKSPTKKQVLVPTSGEFPEGFREPISETLSPVSVRRWLPDTQTLVYTLRRVSNEQIHDLVIPSSLFLQTVSGVANPGLVVEISYETRYFLTRSPFLFEFCP